MREGRGTHRVLVGQFKGREPLKKTRLRWQDNIKIGLQEMGQGMDWFDLAQERNR
jgi:hypothetical protein